MICTYVFGQCLATWLAEDWSCMRRYSDIGTGTRSIRHTIWEDDIPGHVKWPRTQVHYVHVSVGGYSLIPYAFQIDVEAKISNNAALCAGM